jgi:SAM-dependent methyltransferase
MQQPAVEPTYYYEQLDEIGGGDGVWDLDSRWADVRNLADLRPDDEVLDLGCAEGLVTIEVASRVRRVHGIELRPERVEAARQVAAERGIENVTFECGGAGTVAIPERSYDVVLFLGVLQHMKREEKMPTLAKVLGAARRQVVMRMPLFDPRHPGRTTNVAHACQLQDYALTIYPRHRSKGGNLLIATRFELLRPPTIAT